MQVQNQDASSWRVHIDHLQAQTSGGTIRDATCLHQQEEQGQTEGKEVEKAKALRIHISCHLNISARWIGAKNFLTKAMYYQLFSQLPRKGLVERILSSFGVSMCKYNSFTIHDMARHDSVKSIHQQGLVDELSSFYIPCKAKTYLNDLTEKKLLTVIRHLLRTQDLKLKSKTIRMGKDRIQEYTII